MIHKGRNTHYVNVALSIPKGPFTYSVSEEQGLLCKPGMRVRVPFRNSIMIGYITECLVDSPQKRLKPILEVIDREPIVNPKLLMLTHWMSEYYQCSWGEALSNALPSIIRKGRSIKEIPLEKFEKEIVLHHTLTSEQNDVFMRIKELINAGAIKKYLLQGVTGSGKTEVYVHLMKKAIDCGKNVICIVPEIALTVHLMNYFNNYFGPMLEVLHSKMTDAERFKAWSRIKYGGKRVVLGARSALFSPLENVGLIIIDEEHENSFKQNDTPRYHARDVAERRVEIEKAVLLMGTATPSLEARYGCEQGRFSLLRLTSRIVTDTMPEVEVIDLRNEMTRGGDLLVSRPLRLAMEKTLAKKENIILFLNRRGYSTCVSCMECGEVISCKSCKVSLTYHASMGKLICHYCNYRIDPITLCGSCKSTSIKFGGVGTERIQAHVKKMFPNAKVERLDTDRVRQRGEAQAILQRFAQGEIDILIGTQMIAKGFDFPRVTLVGVINADTILSLPDFRSFERGFQLLTQVAGRTGRGKSGGRVIIQTFMPHNYAVTYARHHDYDRFYEEEKMNRAELGYPPFSSLINIIIRSRNEKGLEVKCLQLAEKLHTKYELDNGVEIIGPAPLPFYKLRNYFRWHVMLKGVDSERMRAIAHEIVSSISRSKDTSVAVDVDPISIL
ncbi:primosomal protein N' [Candidatus Omnitrophota bacterium]